MRRTAFVFLSVALFIAGATSVGAAPPNNPFVGSWEAFASNPIGDEHIRTQIGGGGQIQIRTNLGFICFSEYGQPVPLTATGWGSVVNEDPFVWAGQGDAFCHLRDGLGRELVARFEVQFQYDPATDTLISLTDPSSPVIVRTGSNKPPSD